MKLPSDMPIQRPSTATPDGQWKTPEITGLVFRRLTPLEDERGDLTELFRADWGFHPAPVVQMYRVTIRPGAIKAWNLHTLQDDRIAMIDGTLRWAFYDARPDSPTLGNLVVRTVSERSRHLFVIPAGVWHGAENVGTADAAFINFPTTLYNHEHPDRLCLPVENSLIPFAFGPTPGLPATR
jgi:dTDP-4-dehydrorhamnose 3,5-epimerase